jgi:hypothetical protein
MQISQSRNATLLALHFSFSHLDGPHLLYYFGLHQILDEIAVLVLEEESFEGPTVGPWGLDRLSSASLWGFCLLGFEVEEFVLLLFRLGPAGGGWTSL